MAFWFAFSAITVSIYIASLVNFLGAEADLLGDFDEGSTPKYITRKQAIQSASDLNSQSAIQFGMIRGGSTSEFFRVSRIALYEDLYSRVLQDKKLNVDNLEEGMAKVRQGEGKYVLFCESAFAEYFIKQPPCDLEQIGGLLNSGGYGVATPLGSKYRDILSLAVLSLMESGTLQQMYRKWFHNKCVNDGITMEVAKERGLIVGRAVAPKQFTGVAVLLLLGMIAAAVVGAVEFKRGKPKEKVKIYII